jgi:predicted Ser/Thr protein kinase
LAQKGLEDTKGVIRIHKSKDRHHNGQKKKDKKTISGLTLEGYSGKEVAL